MRSTHIASHATVNFFRYVVPELDEKCWYSVLNCDVIERRPEQFPSPEPLLDEAGKARLPHLYSQESVGLNALAQVKFFTPDANWTWYASEGSPVDEDGYFDTDKAKVDYVFFGLVFGFDVELGFFSLSELERVRGPLGLPIERDLYFVPRTLGELMQRLQTGGEENG